MKTTNIHRIIKNVTYMRLASEVTVNRTFENESIQAIVDEINWYIEAQQLPFKIGKAGKGKVEYLNIEHERLDRVIYLLSWLVKGAK